MSKPPDGSSRIDRTAPPRLGEIRRAAVGAATFGGADGRRYVPVASLCEPRIDPDGRIVREVWKYRDVVNERDVVVKLVPTDGRGEMIAEVERIGAALAADIPGVAVLLDHQVIDGGTDREQLALISQFIAGARLDEVATAGLSPERALAIASSLAECLAVLHAAAIVHGDIKPGNVIVRASDDRPVLVDPGSARLAGQPLVASSHLWEPPEASGGAARATEAYDCWSLGLVIATFLGFSPAHEDSPEIRGARAREAVSHGAAGHSDAGKRLATVIAGLLRSTADDRLRAAEALKLLNPPAALRGPRMRRRRATTLVSAVSVIALASGGAYALHQRGPSHPTLAPSRLVVFDKLVFGKAGLREDPIPAGLSGELRRGCHRLGCYLRGSQRHTGGTLPPPVCVVTGPLVTNGSLKDPADDENPNLVASTLWYGVSDGSGRKSPRIRYISEVWVTPRQRGGLGLPTC